MPIQTKVQFRRGTAAAWTAANPVLNDGEPGFETDTKKVKYGDGTTAWVSLPYFSSAWSDLTGVPATFPPSSHTHGGADITGTGKSATTFLRGDNTWVVPTNTTYSTATQAEIESSVSTTGRLISGQRMSQGVLKFAPVQSVAGKTGAVTLGTADVTGLQTALDGKSPLSHSHPVSDVVNLQAALDGKSDVGHTHTGLEISGVNGGTPNSPLTSTQLRRGTTSEWTTYNPVLADGEVGLETDTGKLKFGNGLTAWSGLNYAIPGGSGLQTRDTTGAWKGLQTAMANIQNVPLRWLCIGDSITEGTGVTSRSQTWPIIAAQKLRAAYPSVPQTNPFGWIPIVQASSTLPSNFTLAGSYSTTSAKFGFRGDQTAVLNANATITGSITGTSIDIWHARGASSGTFTVKKNGVQVGGNYGGTNPTTASGFKQTISLGTSGTYTIVITNNSANPVYINGITAWNGNENAGVCVFNGGRHGWVSQNWETVAQDGTWVDDIRTLDPHLVTILLGANDYTSLVGRTEYKSNLRTLINTIRDTQNYWASIVLVACFKRSEVAYPRWEHYEFAMQDVATELGCGYIDLREFMPDVGTQEAIDNSYYYDTVHPATAGMARMGDEISKILLARANGLF